MSNHKMDVHERKEFEELKADVRVIREMISNRLTLLERIVFGTIGLAGSSLILAILYLVIKKQP